MYKYIFKYRPIKPKNPLFRPRNHYKGRKSFSNKQYFGLFCLWHINYRYNLLHNFGGVCAALIQLDKLPRVAHRFEVAQKLLARDNHCTSAVVGVET